MSKRKQIRGVVSASYGAVAILFVALCSPSKSLASLMGDEVILFFEQSAFGFSSTSTIRSTVSDSWEFRIESATLVGIFGGIFADNLIFEIDIYADVIEIRRLSEPYPFFPILFTFSDLDWIGNPNTKLSNVVLASMLPEGSSPAEITFTDDTVGLKTYWGDVDVQRFRLFTSNELRSVAVPTLPIPLLFTGLVAMAFLGWRQ